jgi:SAM-dependent methyltransferase
VPAQVVDVGCGRGVDALWFARQGVRVTGLDYVIRAAEAVQSLAAAEGLDAEFRQLNLVELRSVLAGGARIAGEPGRKVVTGRHIADATDKYGRAQLWRVCEMMLRGGGRLYLEFLVRRGAGDSFARRNHLRTLPVDLVVAELEGRGATVVDRTVHTENAIPGGDIPRRGRRIARLVVEWQR